MSNITNAVAAASAGLATAAIIIILNIPTVAVSQVKVGPSYLGRLPDGGSCILSQYNPGDGGPNEWLRVASDARDCVRKKVGGSDLTCRRGTLIDNASTPELTRFPVAQMWPLSTQCQAVPCAVWYGQDANQDQAALLSSAIGIVLP